MKTKLQVAQNKCIRFCLEQTDLIQNKLGMNKIGIKFAWNKINWLPVERRVELCTAATVFKYCKGIAPSNLNDMFMPSLNNYNTKS